MAAIGVALWKYVMRYAPHTPDYFNRDRFILSNGEYLANADMAKITANQKRPYMSLSIYISSPHRL